MVDRDHPYEVVVVTHWRVVNADGAIIFSTSSREGHGESAYSWLQRFNGRGPKGGPYHIEVWEQTYTVTPSVWRKVRG